MNTRTQGRWSATCCLSALANRSSENRDAWPRISSLSNGFSCSLSIAPEMEEP